MRKKTCEGEKPLKNVGRSVLRRHRPCGSVILSKLSKSMPHISLINFRRTNNVAGNRREGRSRDEAQGEDDNSSDHG